MTKEEYKARIKVLFRQLDERYRNVRLLRKPYKHYTNKVKEFIAFIDEAKQTDWFIMPENGRIFRIYNTFGT